MRKLGALYWLVIIMGSPFLVYFGLALVLGHSVNLCFLTLPSGFLILYLWVKIKSKVKGPTKKWKADESESVEKTERESPTEKYSIGDRSSKKDKSLFSRIFSKEERCEECGTELVYKEGAGAYYCPECKEYKWR